ncbi:phage GP46 family protein [Acinetobacter johnsonii]|uniref:phage GP46 family protein n=1 Tax=Acinetobacter johnsonii TaxID=40214 RepID=UPI00300A9686
MAKIDFSKKDYELASLDEAFTQDEIQSVLICLYQHRGKHFSRPDQGSYLYKLRRSKDVERNKVLARQYAEQALQHLVPSRFRSIEVSASRSESGRIDLSINLVKLTGQSQVIPYFVPVGV